MMNFQVAFPSPPLNQLVDQYWSLEADPSDTGIPSEMVVPNGTAQLIFHYGVPFFSLKGTKRINQPKLLLCGPDIKGGFVTAPGGCGMIGVVFKPAGLAPFLRMPMGELTTQHLPLKDLIATEADELHDRLSVSQEFNSRIRVIESFLTRRMFLPCRFSWGISREGARRIAADPTRIDLTSLADDLGISRRSLERLFRTYIGLSPKLYLRICRFQKTLASLSKAPPIDMAKLALDCGYYDQAHLCNELKEFSGLSPKGLGSLARKHP